MLDVFQRAINSLSPNVGFTFRDNVIDEWDLGDTGEPKPSQADIDAEIVKLQAEYDAQEYARNRASEYPSVQECVHAILDDQLDALQAKRAEIKTKYPKGG